MKRPWTLAGRWLVAGAALLLTGCAFGGVPTADPGRSIPPATSVPPATPAPELTATPASTPPAGVALPDCRYDDDPVTGDPVRDRATIVVDTIYRLPRRYAPDDLVSTGKAGLNGGYKVSRVVIDDLREMADAASAAGAALAVQSAFRSYRNQVTTYAEWVARSSEAEARMVSARPGHSEHQLGTALDFRSADDATPPWALDDYATTRSGGWLHDHAWEYGFVMSYPKDAAAESCYAYEPWHYRYVGRDVAKAVHESGETPRRYLWETYGPGAP